MKRKYKEREDFTSSSVNSSSDDDVANDKASTKDNKASLNVSRRSAGLRELELLELSNKMLSLKNSTIISSEESDELDDEITPSSNEKMRIQKRRNKKKLSSSSENLIAKDNTASLNVSRRSARNSNKMLSLKNSTIMSSEEFDELDDEITPSSNERMRIQKRHNKKKLSSSSENLTDKDNTPSLNVSRRSARNSNKMLSLKNSTITSSEEYDELDDEITPSSNERIRIQKRRNKKNLSISCENSTAKDDGASLNVSRRSARISNKMLSLKNSTIISSEESDELDDEITPSRNERMRIQKKRNKKKLSSSSENSIATPENLDHLLEQEEDFLITFSNKVWKEESENKSQKGQKNLNNSLVNKSSTKRNKAKSSTPNNSKTILDMELTDRQISDEPIQQSNKKNKVQKVNKSNKSRLSKDTITDSNLTIKDDKLLQHPSNGNTQHLEEEQRNSTQQDLHDMDTLPFVRKNSSDENTPFSPKSNKMNQSIRDHKKSAKSNNTSKNDLYSNAKASTSGLHISVTDKSNVTVEQHFNGNSHESESDVQQPETNKNKKAKIKCTNPSYEIRSFFVNNNYKSKTSECIKAMDLLTEMDKIFTQVVQDGTHSSDIWFSYQKLSNEIKFLLYSLHVEKLKSKKETNKRVDSVKSLCEEWASSSSDDEI